VLLDLHTKNVTKTANIESITRNH